MRVAARAALVVAFVLLGAPAWGAASPARIRLEVPIVKQAPERCGPAALRMVLAHHGADSTTLRLADAAYDPVLRGALVTELAAAARRGGHPARVATWTADSLLDALRQGVPPIILSSAGMGPIQRGHYFVVVGWEPERDAFVVHDGGGAPRQVGRRSLVRRWERAGSQALLVAPHAPGASP